MIASSSPAAQLSREDLAATALPAAEPPTQSAPVLCVGYLRTVHPDSGLDVVFVPGEALPAWAAEVQTARQAPEPVKTPSKRGSSLKGRKEAAEREPINLA